VTLRLAAALLFPLLPGCASRALERFEFSRPAMGTEFRIVLHAPDAERARRAAEAAFARIEALDRTLSDYKPESELSRLGARSDGPEAAAWTPVSEDLFGVLELSQELARASGGAFDLTAGPLTRLWRRARRQGELPDARRLEEARASVGFARLELDPRGRRARLGTPGMRLDPGGIGKGVALDAALEVLATHGLRRALVVGGGEMRAGEPPPGARGWRVELVGLEPGSEALELARAGLATSGDLSQALVLDGVHHSHILDPRTGHALSERRLVSVIGPSATWTDALATTLSVLGPEEGLAFLARYPGYAARIQVERHGRIEVLRSASFPAGLSCPTPPALPSP